jgi:hypothetical protein
LVWCFALAFVGMKQADRWNNDLGLKAILHEFDLLIVAIIALCIGGFLWSSVRNRRS